MSGMVGEKRVPVTVSDIEVASHYEDVVDV